jgi:predicted nucleotidyltransferase component of viral defense system
MKEYLFQLAANEKNPIQAKNKIREYLQARILSSLQRAGAMIPLAFYGGTALQFLFNLPRFSEDLDFSLERTKSGYDIQTYFGRIRNELASEGYTISIKFNTKKTVHSGFIQFEDLLFEAGLSPHRNEKISIKLEIDTVPPKGTFLKTTVIRHFVALQLQHHDKSSLFAGKLHAIFSRRYTKGRDIYDLFWYLSDRSWPAPNLNMLNNALKQTDWRGPVLIEKNWRKILKERMNNLAWSKIVSDVRPFLEDERELELLTLENLTGLL